MPEDQVTALPPEVRQMVMTGTTAMMNGGGANPGIMAPGVMMDMSGMMPMPMGMGMNGDMGMNAPMMPVDGRGMMMSDGGPGPGGAVISNGTPEHGPVGVGMIPDGYGGGPTGGMMNMGINGEFAMQVQHAFPLKIGISNDHYKGAKPDGPANVSKRRSSCSRGTRSAKWVRCSLQRWARSRNGCARAWFCSKRAR